MRCERNGNICRSVVNVKHCAIWLISQDRKLILCQIHEKITDDAKWSTAKTPVTRDGSEVMGIAEDFVRWRSRSLREAEELSNRPILDRRLGNHRHFGHGDSDDLEQFIFPVGAARLVLVKSEGLVVPRRQML
jgi:hypothetical protein